MGLLDAWNSTKKDEDNKQKREKFALSNNQAPVKPRSNTPMAAKPSPVPTNIGNGESTGRFDRKGNNPIAAMVRRNDNGGMERSMLPKPKDSQSALFDELLGKMTSGWSGLDKSKIDYSPLDKALEGRMTALQGARDKSQANFDTSDVNLESMYRGHQNNISTEGANRYNQIADTQKANLNASNAAAQANLQGIKAEDSAKRVAMLKNLGLEESAGATDVSADPLNQAIGSIAARNDANVTNAEADRGTNLAFNQGVATSVGQQGVERRGDLSQQLQQVFSKLDMAGADAQSENAQARYQLEQNAGNQQYDEWQNQQGFYNETLGMLQKDAQEMEKIRMGQNKPAEVGGFAGIPQDLRNSGYDDAEIQNVMSRLSEAVSSNDYKNASMSGGDKVSIAMKELADLGITDKALAFQAATNYVNLGSTSNYKNTPY